MVTLLFLFCASIGRLVAQINLLVADIEHLRLGVILVIYAHLRADLGRFVLNCFGRMTEQNLAK